MFLSDRDLIFAIKTGLLIVDPPPQEMDTTSIDLHLDRVERATVWNIAAFTQDGKDAGHDHPTIGVGAFDHRAFATRYHMPVPEDEEQRVFRRGKAVVLKPGGFFLWQSKEKVGTPEEDPRLICFVDGKSTRARTGLVVHMTAPTIHAGWWGQITLEIANLGPFHLELKEGDAIAQIVVAAITSPPIKKKNAKGVAIGQSGVGGAARSP